ncbi:hypothetical protein ZOSMA_56G01220 [Zostera marina]|uniref:PUB 62/63 C-terminal domain-containing protein n=1 Tax=Zostera marina TaxID=29655 RepID=A0A0K9NVU4_ZOSMR|nr:hypothetical protein ZOSMA_56G01220 [Zostera marina]
MMVFEDETGKFPRSSYDLHPSRFMIENNDKMEAIGRGFCRTQGGVVSPRCVLGSSSSSQMEPGNNNHRSAHHRQQWNGEGSNGAPPNVGDDVDEGDGEVDGFISTDKVGVAKNINHNNSSGSVQSSSEKRHNDEGRHVMFGLRTEGADDGRGSTGKKHCNNVFGMTEPELYYARILQGQDVSILVQNEQGRENGCGVSGRKVLLSSANHVDLLRMHLSDPITGVLMDDAMILSCGHSYGTSGMHHITRMKSCFKCGHPASGETVRPNLTLRAAVQAFCKEEAASQLTRSTKRRRNKLEQGKINCDGSLQLDMSRGKGVQFPFEVSDHVIIKGNKRTPQRFVGRMAVVTTQCLNGWYVVKTLDNAESVKLQYRSLAKATDDGRISSKDLSPNWK